MGIFMSVSNVLSTLMTKLSVSKQTKDDAYGMMIEEYVFLTLKLILNKSYRSKIKSLQHSGVFLFFLSP